MHHDGPYITIFDDFGVDMIDIDDVSASMFPGRFEAKVIFRPWSPLSQGAEHDESLAEVLKAVGQSVGKKSGVLC